MSNRILIEMLRPIFSLLVVSKIAAGTAIISYIPNSLAVGVPGFTCGTYRVSFHPHSGAPRNADGSWKPSRLVVNGKTYYGIANLSGFPRGFNLSENPNPRPSLYWNSDGVIHFRMSSHKPWIRCKQQQGSITAKDSK